MGACWLQPAGRLPRRVDRFRGDGLVRFLALFRGRKAQIIIGGTPLFLLLIAATMPKKLLSRYGTLSEREPGRSHHGDDDTLDASAIASTDARMRLLTKSIKYTLYHPLFGVGPGMFAVAEDKEAHANGLRHGTWQGTHNSYTQVSSELGIPGCIFYVLVIFWSLKTTSAYTGRPRTIPVCKTSRISPSV